MMNDRPELAATAACVCGGIEGVDEIPRSFSHFWKNYYYKINECLKMVSPPKIGTLVHKVNH